MAYSDYTAIYSTLAAHLDLLVFTSPIPIADPNVDFKPSGVYLETSFQPNRPPGSPIGYTTDKPRQGLFQVSVKYPENKGVSKAYDIADKIAQHFAPREEPISRAGSGPIRITEDPSIGGHIKEDSGRVMVPVTISWVVW